MNTSTPTASDNREEYLERLYSRVPIYDTRLVAEGAFPFTEREQVKSPEGIAAILQEYFARHDREEVLLVMLDTGKTVIGISRLSVGGLSQSIVEPRQVFKAAILGNADAIVLAHNHPSGNPQPSQGDIRLTRRISEAGKLMDVPLIDHLIITKSSGYTSLAQRGDV